MSIVSNNIKYLRRLNALTQEQFARRIGIKRSLLGAYEEARANPNLDNLKVIANTFGVSVDNLIKVDIRKLRDTHDFTSVFPPKTEPISNHQAIYHQPKPLGEVMNDFLNERPIATQHKEQSENTLFNNDGFDNSISDAKRTGIKLLSQRVFFKPVHKNSTSNSTFQRQSFNNIYETIPRKDSVESEKKVSHQNIRLVSQKQFLAYLNNFQDTKYLEQLTDFQVPFLSSGEYRAFEINEDFQFANSLLIGTFVRNWFEILDGKCYILVTKSQGIIYRRVYNEVKTKGILLLYSEVPNRTISPEISIKEVVEVWEVQAFISKQLPETSVSLDKLTNLIEEAKVELERIGGK